MAMESIMLAKGNNNYPLGHMRKAKLRRSHDGLPEVYSCSQEAVDAALEMLML